MGDAGGPRGAPACPAWASLPYRPPQWATPVGSAGGALGAAWGHWEHHGGIGSTMGGTGSTVGALGAPWGALGAPGGGALGALWGALGAPGGHRGTTMEGHWEHRGGHRGSPGGLLQHWLWGAPGEGIHPGLGCPQWFRPSRLWGAPPGSHPCRLSGGSCSGLGVPPGRPRTPSPVAWQSRPREHRVAQGQRHRGKRVTPWRHGGPAPSHGSGD